jgi:hypothetical protein
MHRAVDMAALEGLGFIGAMMAENQMAGGKLVGYSDGMVIVRSNATRKGMDACITPTQRPY